MRTSLQFIPNASLNHSLTALSAISAWQTSFHTLTSVLFPPEIEGKVNGEEVLESVTFTLFPSIATVSNVSLGEVRGERKPPLSSTRLQFRSHLTPRRWISAVSSFVPPNDVT